ncbi:MAG: DUF4142 domain-containing protein [Gemmatimonadales bacterium]
MRHRRLVIILGLVAGSPAFGLSLAAQYPPRPAEPRQDTTSRSRPKDHPRLTDANIFAVFDRANLAEVEIGKLAEKQGSTAEVRDIGAMLVRDHTKKRETAQELAKKLGITPTLPPDGKDAEDHTAKLKDLGDKKGTDFDKAFLEITIGMHEQTLEDVREKLIPAATNPELKALLEQGLPGVQAHLDRLQSAKTRIAAR